MWLSTLGYSRPTSMWPCMIRQRSSAGSAYHSRDFTNGYTNTYLPRKPRGTVRSSSEYSELLRMPRNECAICRPLHQPALRQHDVELVDAVEVLGLGEQHQLGVAARADERERLQQVPVGEVLAGGHQLALVLRATLGVQPPPRRVDLEERVLDEVTSAHVARLSQPASRGLARGAGRRLLRWIELARAHRAPLAVLVDVPGWCDSSHRGARARARRRRPRGSRAGAVRSRRRAVAPAAPRRAPAAPSTPAGASSRLGAQSASPPTAPSPTWRSRRTPSSRCARSCATGGYDVVHIHEPVVPILSWDALCSAGELPLVGTFHTYSENALTNGVDRRWARRAAADEPAARPHRRVRGRRVDGPTLLRRALSHRAQRRVHPDGARARARHPRRAHRGARRWRSARAAHPVHRAGGRAQGPARAAARLRGAARARARDAHARRRVGARRSRT